MQYQSAATFRSFDSTEESSGFLLRPDRYRQLFSDLSSPGAISRGAGLNYCIASAAKDGRSVLSEQFNRFLAFDEATNIVRVEPGVNLGDLLAFASARNLLPPVIPGYPTITVGGAVAMNVHGKNQFKTGNFADHVKSLTLYHPDKGETTCSLDENPALFSLTLGGFGLTGHITSVSLALAILPGRGLKMERHLVSNLRETVDLMEKLSDTVDYLYSWHNLNLSGDKFGSGVLYTERHCADGSGVPFKNVTPLTVKPFPVRLFNDFTVPPMCRAYYLKEKLSRREQTTGLSAAYFPFVGKEVYFRLFGKPGFREYQVLFPRDGWEAAEKQIAEAIRRTGAVVTLGSLKLIRGKRRLLNFSGDGICLALDTPNSAAAIMLFSRLDEITIDLGGIANISKDGRLNAGTVRSMYGNQFSEFREALRAYDPDAHFQSDLRRRLEL